MAACDQLYGLASDLLTAVEAGLVECGVEVPEHAYLVTHEPAFDCCPGLMVSVARVFPGVVGGEEFTNLQCGARRVAELVVWLLRCVSSSDEGGEPPSPTVLEEEAHTSLLDADALNVSLLQAFRTGGVLQDPCRNVGVGAIEAITPEGTCAGWKVAIQFELTGINPSAS